MLKFVTRLARACAALAGAMALVISTGAGAASTLPLYLDEMADNAAVAFEGRCLSNRTELDAATGLIVTYTTFEVRDVLKGSVGGTHEIKQVGGELPGGGPQFRVMGVPRFEVGEDYVVFLAGVSSVGFSSPMGLSQGRFRVDAKGGAKKVGNGRDFKDMTQRLFTKVPASARSEMDKTVHPVREMDLEDFKKTVRAHLGAKR